MSLKDTRGGMSEKDREAWNSRPVQTTVRDLCDCCKTLQQAVKERTNAYPYFKLKSCQGCFDAECTKREKERPLLDPYEFYI